MTTLLEICSIIDKMSWPVFLALLALIFCLSYGVLMVIEGCLEWLESE